GAAALVRVTADVGIERRDSLSSIDQNECHITALQMFPSLNHAELFRQQSSLPLTADSCRVDQPEIETIVFQFGVNTVPGRSRQGRDDGAFLAKQPVEQRRLADIRVPNNG